MVFTTLNPPKYEVEKVDKTDLKVLDKTTLTSVVDFMRKFQSDADFAPPTVDVLFDSENYKLDIDSEEEFPSQFEEIDDLPVDELNERVKRYKDAG